MPPSRDKLDAERSREGELYSETLRWLESDARSDGTELGDRREFVATIVASIPEIANVIELSVAALQNRAVEPENATLRDNLVHVLRWQLGEALLRCLSLETPPGVTWTTILDTLSDWTDHTGDEGTQPTNEVNATDRSGSLRMKLLELKAVCGKGEVMVRDRAEIQSLKTWFHAFYLSLLETLAATERVLSQTAR